jgi:LCP family protein required for cell wall assembly
VKTLDHILQIATGYIDRVLRAISVIGSRITSFKIPLDALFNNRTETACLKPVLSPATLPGRKRMSFSNGGMVIVLCMMVVLGCSLPGLNITLPVSSIGGDTPIILVDASGFPPTPTPFQPIPPTATYFPEGFAILTPLPSPVWEIAPTLEITQSEVSAWGSYPGPTQWPDIEIPPPVGLLPQPAGQVNILLLGSDLRAGRSGYRTDSILLLTLNPAQGIASMTSFPRDLYVYIPGWTIQRLNAAQPHGGFNTTALTFEYNFGVRPDHYILIDMGAFPNVIDSLGGVDVNVAQTLTDHRDGVGDYTIYAGVVHMDGETALWYARSRATTNDFDRSRRQQEVLQACFDKLISLDGISRAPDLYNLYIQSVSTDMNFDQMTEFLPLAADLRDSSHIHRYTIGSEQVENYINSNGAMVLLPNRDAILDIMRQVLSSP